MSGWDTIYILARAGCCRSLGFEFRVLAIVDSELSWQVGGIFEEWLNPSIIAVRKYNCHDHINQFDHAEFLQTIAITCIGKTLRTYKMQCYKNVEMWKALDSRPRPALRRDIWIMMMFLIADIQRVIVNLLTTVTWQSLISHNDAQCASCNKPIIWRL